MKLQALYSNKNNSFKQPRFNGLHVIDTDVQKLLLTTLNSKQLDILSGCIKEQRNNSVHIILGSKNRKQLKADFICDYRLQDFKTKYTQRFLFESRLDFIKRIVNVANEYQKQIQNFEVSKLKWDYAMLPEWVSKVLLRSQASK